MHVIRASNEDFIDHQSIFEDAFEATASIIHTSEDERSDTPYDRCVVKVVELFAVSAELATGGWLRDYIFRLQNWFEWCKFLSIRYKYKVDKPNNTYYPHNIN